MAKKLMRKPKWPDSWIMENVDKAFLANQVSIVLKDYELNQNQYHGGPLQNLLGILAEYAFEGFLIDRVHLAKSEYVWHTRTFNHQKDMRPWDFRVADSDELTFEIGAARPDHKYAILKKADYKVKSKYFVQVRIDQLRCIEKVYYKRKERWFLFDTNNRDATELEQEQAEELRKSESHDFARATVLGFDKPAVISKLENGWKLGLEGKYPTYDADGWYKPISELRPLSELKDIIEDIIGYG
jgi:hypothetical protein